jgi:hypothetical protein
MDVSSRYVLDDAGHLHEMDGTDTCIGTVEHLIALAWEGRLSKDLLAGLLEVDKRPEFLEACARIEKQYTDECAARNDPCLESGCAVEGEICLQPLLNAGDEYRKACAAAWVTFFADPRNRVAAWRPQP